MIVLGIIAGIVVGHIITVLIGCHQPCCRRPQTNAQPKQRPKITAESVKAAMDQIDREHGPRPLRVTPWWTSKSKREEIQRQLIEERMMHGEVFDYPTADKLEATPHECKHPFGSACWCGKPDPNEKPDPNRKHVYMGRTPCWCGSIHLTADKPWRPGDRFP